MILMKYMEVQDTRAQEENVNKIITTWAMVVVEQNGQSAAKKIYKPILLILKKYGV